MKTELEDLTARAKKGDMTAFEQLVSQSEKIVYNIAYRMMYNAEDAKDVTQEVFIKVYKNLERFDGRSAFSTWVYRIAVNTCIDEIRKRKEKQVEYIEENLKHQDMPQTDIAKTPEENYLVKEEGRELLELMENLSQEHKTILNLRDIQGFSYEEISNITETSLGTVKSRLARARQQLKTEILKRREQNQNLPRHTNRKEEKLHEM